MAVVHKLRCQVANIIDHGLQVYTLELRPERPVPRFRPGQFLHLALDEYDPAGFWPESRVFSIASAPKERACLRVSYAVRGRFTARMERELSVGSTVWIKMPYGDFIVDGSRPAVLLAGGTGITAFTAFIEELEPDHSCPVWLVYGARDRQRLIGYDLVQRQVQRVAQLRVFYFVERDDDPPGLQVDTPSASWEVGRISCGAIWGHLNGVDHTVFYLSGPPAMVQALTHELRGLGVAPAAIRTDAWE